MNKKDKDIEPYNDKHQRHGLWEIYCNGELWYKCFFQNGRLVGYDEEYYLYNSKLVQKRYNL
jgi:hypothetical protein